MATEQDQQTAASRYVLLGALATVITVGALGFGRVFQGRGTTGRLVLAGLVALGLAWLTERRHILIAALASAAGLAVAVAILIFPETTRLGVPTLATWRALRLALKLVNHAANAQVAPALPLKPLILAALSAVWAAAFAAHALAVRARTPILALLPPAALLAFASILLGDGARYGYAVPFLASSLAVLFADGLRRIGQWGPVSLWHERRRRLVGSAATGRAARRLGAACLAVAAFAPWVLPGFRSPGLLAVNGDHNPLRVSIDPIVDIRPALLTNPNVRLFTVRTAVASYWRFLALDQFNGRQWTSSALDGSSGQPIPEHASLSLGTGIDPATVSTVSRQVTSHFDFDRLSQLWLPAAYDPIRVSGKGSLRFDPEHGALVAPDGTYPGYSYDVTSLEVVPSPADLDATNPLLAPALDVETQLPPDTPKEIYQIAHKLTDGKKTVYRKILAIQDYLTSSLFQYSQHVAPGHDINHVLYFLTTSHKGYCEQFAGTMAVLLRALGIPARVAVGFTPGAYDPKTNSYTVSAGNAHAWVEVMFPGYGWLAFEPTPTRTNSLDLPYIQPPSSIVPIGGLNGVSCADLKRRGCPAVAPPLSGKIGKGGLAGHHGNQLFDNSEHQGVKPPSFAPPPAPPPGIDWRFVLLLSVLLLTMLLIVAVPTGKVVRRRWTLARAKGANDTVLAAYRVAGEQASDLGLGRRLHETFQEYRARITARVGSLAEAFDQLTSLAVRAAYSDVALSPEQARQAVVASRQVSSQLRRSAGRPRRLFGMFRIERLSR